MNKMKFRNRCFIMALICMLVWAGFAFAEDLAQTEPASTAPKLVEIETPDTRTETVEDHTVAEDKEYNEDGDPEISIWDGIKKIASSTGLANGSWREYVMIAIACLLLYLAIVKQFEPLLLLPIAFGMLLANLPMAGLGSHTGPSYTFFNSLEDAVAGAASLGKESSDIIPRYNELTGLVQYSVQTSNGGLLYYLYLGVNKGIYPPLIFMGVGAMTDFAPLIADPKSLLLGAAAQLGIFITFIIAKATGVFSAAEAGAIGIIGGADGPTAIFVTTKLAPHLLGPIAVAAYSYMALVPVIQPPIMKALTTEEERRIRMPQLRPVSKTELVIFPILVTVIVSLILPDAATLIGCLMLGNLLHVSGVTERLNKTVQNELINIVTIFLGVTVGATTTGSEFLSGQTILIIAMGVFAFGCGTAGGVLMAKLMNKLTGGRVNPLIGSAGVSAVPMAARVSNKVGQEYDPGNFLLMNAMGPNVAGVIGSAVAAGVMIALFG